MADFIRARSEEQKAQRMADVKQATEALFAVQPYHAITMSTIAEELGWTRTKLYKYVTTKEEVFLALCADKQSAYFAALQAAYPVGADYAPAVLAEVWAGILNCHRDYLRYCDILMTIIETNVAVERLAAFKRNYYAIATPVEENLAANLHLSLDDAKKLCNTVQFHATGLCCNCTENPLVREALALLGKTPPHLDFPSEMKEFILMCIEWAIRSPKVS